MNARKASNRAEKLNVTLTMSFEPQQLARLFGHVAHLLRGAERQAGSFLPVAQAGKDGKRQPSKDRSDRDERLLIDTKAVAKMLSVSRSTIYQMLYSGQMPAPVRLPGKMVRWRLDEIMAWIETSCSTKGT